MPTVHGTTPRHPPSRRLSPLRLLALGPALLVLFAAGPPGEVPATPAGWSIDNFRWHGELAPGRGVVIRNTLGDVRVRGAADEGVELSAFLQRRASDAAKAEVKVGQGSELLEISVVYPGGEPPPAPRGEPRRRVDLAVFLPEDAALQVTVGVGQVEIEDCDGGIEVHAGGGDVRLVSGGDVRVENRRRGSISATLQPAGWSRPPELYTESGDIALYLPGAAGARIEATTAGEITTDYSLTVERPGGGAVKHALAVVGGGGPAVYLKSQNGNLKLLQFPG